MTCNLRHPTRLRHPVTNRVAHLPIIMFLNHFDANGSGVMHQLFLYPLPVLQRISTFAYQDVLESRWCEWLRCNDSAVDDVPFGQFFILFASLPMGWLRLVGSIKLQVSFAKEPWKKRQYSAKETYNLIDPTNRSHPISWYSCITLMPAARV